MTTQVLLLLLFAPEHLKFLDYKNGASVPHMFHQTDCFLEHCLLEGHEIIKIQSSRRHKVGHICLGIFVSCILQTCLIFDQLVISMINHKLEVSQVDKLDFAELLPPRIELRNDNVESYQAESDLRFSLDSPLVRPLEFHD